MIKQKDLVLLSYSIRKLLVKLQSESQRAQQYELLLMLQSSELIIQFVSWECHKSISFGMRDVIGVHRLD